MRQLGLLPLAKKLQLHVGGCGGGCYFSSDWLHCRILRQFPALTNVQELGTNHLDIPSFMPRIRRYFGHFLPTVRSLILRAQRGPSADNLLHWNISTPGRPHTHLPLDLLSGRASGRPDTHSIVCPSIRGRLTLTRSGSVNS